MMKADIAIPLLDTRYLAKEKHGMATFAMG